MRNDINEAHEAIEDDSNDSSTKKERKIVVPGEVIASGDDFLPGEGAAREGNDVVASRYGLSEKAGRVIKVIPLSGAFVPRRNNVVLGRISDITYNGWLIDIDAASNAFLPIAESPRFIEKSEMGKFLAIGDMVSAKIWSDGGRSIDLTMKGKGLGKLEGGFVFHISPSRVPRIIGREGSMISLIKEHTGCAITVGQNGWIWIKGNDIDNEIKARNVITYIAEKVYIDGLTDKVEEWFAQNK